MDKLGCILVCALGKFLVPIFVAARTVNNLDFANDGYESR